MGAHRELGRGRAAAPVGFSPDYSRAVEAGALHHQRSKTYSGMLMRPHKPFLSAMIERLRIASALDYGAGKGLQYEWVDPADGKTLEQAWGFEVRKFDPCWPPFADEPDGRFDLVICTHTLSLVPIGDLDAVLAHVFGFARKAVFIAEKIGPRKKAEAVSGSAAGWTKEQWLDRIAPFADHYRGLETVFSSRERTAAGAIMTRTTRRNGGWHGVIAGPQ